MARYEHFLAASRPRGRPTAIIGLDVRVDWIPDPDHEDRQLARLVQWSACCAAWSGKEYQVTRTAAGCTPQSWWDTLRTAALRSRNVWVICRNFRRCSSSLGLWERLESGEVRLNGTDPKSRKGRNGNLPPVRESMHGLPLGQCVPMDTGSLLHTQPPMAEEGGGRREKRTRGRGGSGPIAVLEDPPVILQIRIGDGSPVVTLVDIANYGLAMEDEHETSSQTAARIVCLCRSASSALDAVGPAGWCATAGSQAMHLFRCRYLTAPILAHTQPHASVLEADALLGGRCETYTLGRVAHRVHLMDIRSMYPYLCTHQLLPSRLVGIVAGLLPADAELLGEQYGCIARCDVQVDEPILPYRSDAGVSYPVGRYTTTLCGPELAVAIERGYVQYIRRLAYYRMDAVLREYMLALYDIRCRADVRGDVDLSRWAKALMVSLPGKFAQRDNRWVDMPSAEARNEWDIWHARGPTGESARWRSLAGHVQIEQCEGWSHGAVPALSAWVASLGRDRLRRVIECAGWEHTHYCDTDAVVVDDYGLENLTLADWCRPGEWGYLQHVVSGDDAEIYGVKHYRIGDRYREAGMPRTYQHHRGKSGELWQCPWLGWSLLHSEHPGEWRKRVRYTRGPGRYDDPRESGGRVKTPEQWRYDEQ